MSKEKDGVLMNEYIPSEVLNAIDDKNTNFLFNLALRYELEENQELADFCYFKAAENGHELAKEMLKHLSVTTDTEGSLVIEKYSKKEYEEIAKVSDQTEGEVNHSSPIGEKAPDFYKYHRTPSTSYLQSFERPNKASMGIFDPTSFVIELDEETFENIENINVIKPEKIGTLLHETVHWWQTAGTTSGFITSSIYSAQGQLMRLLQGVASCYAKPLCKSIPQRGNEIDKKAVSSSFELVTAFALIKQFFLLENTHAFIQDARFHNKYSELVRQTISEDDSANDELSLVDEWEQGLLLSKMITFREVGKSCFGEPMELWREYEKIYEHSKTGNGYRDIFSKTDIGYYQICEGQARFYEMLYIAAKDKSLRSFESLKKCGYLGSVYKKAFDRFIQWTDLAHPEYITDRTIHLFLTVCDISLNPSVGYPKGIPNLNTYFSEFHPGARFYTICKYLKTTNYCKGDEGFGKRDFFFDHSFDFRSAEIICDGMNNRDAFEMPGVFTMEMQLLKQLTEERKGSQAIGLNLLFMSHLEFTTNRSIFGNEFGNPLAMLLEKPTEFKKTLPPFIRVGEQLFTANANSHGYGSKEAFAISYFTHQIMVDLLRQYVTLEGDYRLNYDWLPKGISETATMIAKDQANKIFGLSI